MCALYLRIADGVVVTYDITSMSSFDNVKKWFEIAKVCIEHTVYLLLPLIHSHACMCTHT